MRFASGDDKRQMFNCHFPFIFQFRASARNDKCRRSSVLDGLDYSFPSFGRGFDSHRPLHKSIVDSVTLTPATCWIKALKPGFWSKDGPKPFVLVQKISATRHVPDERGRDWRKKGEGVPLRELGAVDLLVPSLSGYLEWARNSDIISHVLFARR